MSRIRKTRKSLVDDGFDTTELDAEIDLLKGTKGGMGLFQVLGVSEDPVKEKKPVDPLQRDIADSRDYRTHSLNTELVRSLVAAEISENPAVDAIRVLNGLEDGEGDREGGPRKSVLDVIIAARRPLIAKVDQKTADQHVN